MAIVTKIICDECGLEMNPKDCIHHKAIITVGNFETLKIDVCSACADRLFKFFNEKKVGA